MSTQGPSDQPQPGGSSRRTDGSTPSGSGSRSRSRSGSASGGSKSGSGKRWQGKRLGKFRLLSLLGKGAMGKVFLAEDTTLHRQVALKILTVKNDSPTQSNKAKQFIREARAAARLNHPNIVNVLEISELNDMLYIAMDLVEGGDVKRLLDNGGAVPPAKACDLAADAADALAFAHRLDVIHRDIKPSNLMLTRQGRCKIADFGLAELNDPNDDFRLPDGVIGTAKYMSPEVAQGQTATPASDQYSLGCTLWHMLAGRAPFEADTFKQVLHMQVNQRLPKLAKLVRGLPDSLVEAIETSLAKDPQDRHPDCETFARLLRGHSIALGPAGASASLSTSTVYVAPAGRPSAGKPWLWPAVAGAALALGVGVGGATLLMNNDASDPVTGAASSSTSSLVDLPDHAPSPSSPPSPADSPDAAHTLADTPTTNTSPPPAVTTPTAQAAVPLPTADEPAPPLAAGVIAASQTDLLKQLAREDKTATVQGTVATAQLSKSGKTFMVKFEGNYTGDFQVIWKPRDFQAMQQAFGGENGSGIAGQTIQATGEITTMFGTPQIVVTTPDQIAIQ